MSLKGNLIGLKIANKFISLEVSSELTFETEMLATAATLSGRYKEFIAGMKSWSLTASGRDLIQSAKTDASTVLASFTGAGVVRVDFRLITKGVQYISVSGYALIREGSLPALTSKSVDWTVVFQGSGAFELDLLGFDKLVDSMPDGPFAPFPDKIIEE